MHISRSNRKENETRKDKAAAKQSILSVEEQLKRASERKAAHKAMYPTHQHYHDRFGNICVKRDKK